MTSSRPLSFGGFDTDITDRPQTISSALSSEGYHTTHITPVHWVNSAFGYLADDEIALFSPKALERAVGRLIREPLMRYASGDLPFAAADTLTQRQIGTFFRALQELCATKVRMRASGNSALCIEAQRFRWASVSASVATAEGRWRNARAEFLRNAGTSLRSNGRWLPGIRWEFLRTLGDVWDAGPSSVFASALQKHAPHQARRIRHKRRTYPDAARMVDAVLATAEARREDEAPFFIWAHLFDAHIPYSSGEGTSWASDAPRWLSQTGHDPTIDPFVAFGPAPWDPASLEAWIACYDAAVAFIDAQIGRLQHELARRGLESTLLVLSSDHGEELGEHGDTNHRFRLYEHNCRVHMSFHHPDLSARDTPGLCTLLDIAPTIAELASARQPEGWEGRSLNDLAEKPRQRVLLETFFGSPCNPLERPIYFAARSGDFKLMWCETVDKADPLSLVGARLFNVVSDPHELVDIAELNPGLVEDLIAPMIERKADLVNAFRNRADRLEVAA